ncbi:hypothetical protein CLOM_g21533, partial [Closterium sp. NIES-68]
AASAIRVTSAQSKSNYHHNAILPAPCSPSDQCAAQQHSR